MKAIEYYTKALTLDPKNELLLLNRIFLRTITSAGSAAFLGMEEIDKAMADAEEAIRKNPDFFKGYFRKASALRQVDRVEEAIDFLKSTPEKVRQEPSIGKLLDDLNKDYAEDHVLPKGSLRRIRFL